MQELFWSGRPQCDIRVVPTSAGPLLAMTGAFRLMEFTDHRPVVYAALASTSVFLEDHESIGRYRIDLKAVAQAALDEEQSMGLLAQLANEYDRPGAPQDDDAFMAMPDLA